MSDTHGTVWWTELMTRDVEGAKAFYGTVCGWSFESVPMGDDETYVLGLCDGQPMIGIYDMSAETQADDMPPYWFSYFAVDDLDVALTRAEAAGGTVMRAAFTVPGTGRIAVVSDSTGASVGLMTPEPMPDEG